MLLNGKTVDTNFASISKHMEEWYQKKALEAVQPSTSLRKFCGLDRILIYKNISDKGTVP